MNTQNLKIYCVTNKEINFLKENRYILSWVGEMKAPQNYIACDNGENIYYKEKFYSELTFHYWYWKNVLPNEKRNQWVGFCQKRRFWTKEASHEKINLENLGDYIIKEPLVDWSNYEAIICKPIKVSGAKKIKIIKRGWKNLLKDPSILFNKKKQNLSLHFDMHHGYGNLEKAINELDEENKSDFYEYMNSNNTFNPHIMFISKPEIIDRWFKNLFEWLERCEKHFEFKNLNNYDTKRLFAFLAERYLSYWFKKNTICKEENWIQLENF
tara:strand:+ start:562 stop:1368 length:807 start_codon:yes stop_codon:yes gene_type:complete